MILKEVPKHQLSIIDEITIKKPEYQSPPINVGIAGNSNAIVFGGQPHPPIGLGNIFAPRPDLFGEPVRQNQQTQL